MGIHLVHLERNPTIIGHAPNQINFRAFFNFKFLLHLILNFPYRFPFIDNVVPKRPMVGQPLHALRLPALPGSCIQAPTPTSSLGYTSSETIQAPSPTSSAGLECDARMAAELAALVRLVRLLSKLFVSSHPWLPLSIRARPTSSETIVMM